MRTTQISHQLVEFIPEVVQDGVLYVSLRYGTAVHKCFCGCGEEVVTPLGPTDWSIRIDGHFVTLYPSVGNWSYACRSHYFIRRSNIIWAGDMTVQEIEWGRTLDRAEKAAHFERVNQAKIGRPTATSSSAGANSERPGLLDRIYNAFKGWFGEK